MARGGIYRGSRRQRGGVFRGSRRQRGGRHKGRCRQRGGIFPLALLGAALPAIKAGAAAAGLGALGAAGHHVGDAIMDRIRGGGRKNKLHLTGRLKQV